jgi:glycosyltransferase involved in cell wall biosynthesis
MKPLTILVLPGWYPTSREPLAGPFVRDHARAAAAYGHNVVALVDEGPRHGVRGLFELPESRDGELRVVRFDHWPRTGRVAHIPAILSLARRLAREGTPVDVIHAHVHWMGWPAVLAGAILRRPVVISEHSTEWPRQAITRGALARARFAFQRAALVCPVTVALQRAIESYGIQARFRVVSNPVDTTIFFPPPAMPNGQPVRLVNVALHGPNKGLDVLLRAFETLVASRPELTLALIGDGPLTPRLRELASDLGLDTRVRFAGPLDSHAVAAALRDSHVFVLASLFETQCIAVMEALCCGLPVAATKVGGVPEVVQDGCESVLAPPNDPEALAKAVETILDRYPELDRMAFALRAAERFSLDAIGRIWDEIYRSLTRHREAAIRSD